MAIADLRREYSLSTLDRPDLAPDPIDQFQKWFGQAAGNRGSRLRKFGVALYKAFHGLFTGYSVEPNAMALATADIDGHPSVRTVLLKGADAGGFTFFTNYQSRKGRELATNPWAAFTFYWPDLERQVCVGGSVTQLAREESERYFRSRPRESRIAAWASDQSAVVPDRAALEARWRQIEEQFHGKDIPLPPFWGGYLLSPYRIEFWQGRPGRLHDRFCYTRVGGTGWKLDRLAP
jgi:pyridoxamine 5'-phosphate oxidase